jgi:hypothetical protein
VSPTVARVGPYRFFFYANDVEEPPHIHAQRARGVAKFWLDPVALAKSTRFEAHELTRVEKIVRERRDEFLEAWHGFFGS